MARQRALDTSKIKTYSPTTTTSSPEDMRKEWEHLLTRFLVPKDRQTWAAVVVNNTLECMRQGNYDERLSRFTIETLFGSVRHATIAPRVGIQPMVAPVGFVFGLSSTCQKDEEESSDDEFDPEQDNMVKFSLSKLVAQAKTLKLSTVHEISGKHPVYDECSSVAVATEIDTIIIGMMQATDQNRTDPDPYKELTARSYRISTLTRRGMPNNLAVSTNLIGMEGEKRFLVVPPAKPFKTCFNTGCTIICDPTTEDTVTLWYTGSQYDAGVLYCPYTFDATRTVGPRAKGSYMSFRTRQHVELINPSHCTAVKLPDLKRSTLGV